MKYVIPTKIVGVSFKNSDGSDRQEIIRQLQLDEKLRIEPEPDNPYDKNSHVIKNKDNQIIGHISKELAEDLVEKVKSGETLIGIKGWKVTGQEKHTLGINIVIELDRKEDWNQDTKINDE